MSSLKQNIEVSDSSISDEDKTVQLDFNFSEKKNEDMTDTRNVIPLPKIPVDVMASTSLPMDENKNEELQGIEKKKELVLSELAKLEQYLQDKSKKFQEAKSFIEQYERVVTNKQKYIAESEGERNALLLEVEAFKKSKEKIKKEIEEHEHELKQNKKLVEIEKANAANYEEKTQDMLLHHNAVQKSLKEITNQKNELERIVLNLEKEAMALGSEIELHKSNIENTKRELVYAEKIYSEKKNEIKGLDDVHDRILEQYKNIEESFEKHISKLKEDEFSSKISLDRVVQEIEEYKTRCQELQGEISDKVSAKNCLEIEIEQEQCKLRRINELVLSEKEEENYYRQKRSDHEKKIEEANHHFYELEKKCIREQVEVDFLKSKKSMLTQECDGLYLQKCRLEESIAELEKRKELIASEMIEVRKDKLDSINTEIKLKLEEAKNYRDAHAVVFKNDLAKERQSMLDSYWAELAQKTSSLSEEVVNYVKTQINVSLDEIQKKHLYDHIFSLAKYYESSGSKEDDNTRFFKNISFYVKYFQPYILIMLLVSSIVSIILATN